MENVIDIRLALEQFGTDWKFSGSVTDGTQQAWEAVYWEDSRAKPSWDDLCAAHVKWTKRSLLFADIAALEAQQTDRRMRDAALTDAGKEWLQNLEDKIAAKREELSGL